MLVDGNLLAFGDAEMQLNSNIEVINAPNRTPVQIYYRYKMFSSGFSENETDGWVVIQDEGTLVANNVLKLNNVDLIPRIPNWNSTSGAIGYYDALCSTAHSLYLEEEIKTYKSTPTFMRLNNTSPYPTAVDLVLM